MEGKVINVFVRIFWGMVFAKKDTKNDNLASAFVSFLLSLLSGWIAVIIYTENIYQNFFILSVILTIVFGLNTLRMFKYYLDFDLEQDLGKNPQNNNNRKT